MWQKLKSKQLITVWPDVTFLVLKESVPRWWRKSTWATYCKQEKDRLPPDKLCLEQVSDLVFYLPLTWDDLQKPAAQPEIITNTQGSSCAGFLTGLKGHLHSHDANDIWCFNKGHKMIQTHSVVESFSMACRATCSFNVDLKNKKILWWGFFFLNYVFTMLLYLYKKIWHWERNP